MEMQKKAWRCKKNVTDAIIWNCDPHVFLLPDWAICEKKRSKLPV